MVELIKKKRDGKALNREEIESIITGFVKGDIPDYQISAFLMATFFQGMDTTETAILTDAMMRSGDLINLESIDGIKVDKHSTGGVGDKTTIILAPLVAAAGVPVAKMSGRGLGHTGGTLDKLEAIPGLSVNMSREKFIDQVKIHGIAVCGQNAKLVPADKKIYALRDVTSTVDNISLITSSIMSKKLACGADAIVIDIKVGEGAFMKNLQEAEVLARLIIDTGRKMGREVITVISAMHEPLGLTIGNALEVKEAIDTLKGQGPEDLTKLCLELGSQMLLLAKASKTKEESIELLKKLISSGEAMDKFKQFVQAQGGDIQAIDNPDLLPGTQYQKEFSSTQDGYIQQLNARSVGLASVKLGAGRATKTSVLDLGAGIVLQKKIGAYVKVGESLATLYYNNQEHLAKAIQLMEEAFVIGDTPPIKKPLILKIIS